MEHGLGPPGLGSLVRFFHPSIVIGRQGQRAGRGEATSSARWLFRSECQHQRAQTDWSASSSARVSPARLQRLFCSVCILTVMLEGWKAVRSRPVQPVQSQHGTARHVARKAKTPCPAVPGRARGTGPANDHRRTGERLISQGKKRGDNTGNPRD